MIDYKKSQEQWNATPCGTGDFLDGLNDNTVEYFDEIRKSRDSRTDPWMLRAIDFNIAIGKKLLEIGHGIGSDLLTFRDYGAEVYRNRYYGKSPSYGEP